MKIVGQVHSYDVQTRGEYTNYFMVLKLSSKEYVQLEITKFQYEYLNQYKDIVHADIKVTGRLYNDKAGVEKCMNNLVVGMVEKTNNSSSASVTANEANVYDPKKSDLSDQFNVPDCNPPENDLPW